MKLHILGICGTFMGGIAALARAQGHAVDGSDANVYPPMSDQLEQLGISLSQGYRADAIAANTDVVLVGNALSRGNAAVEHVLDAAIPYASGAQWLHDHVLPGRRVLAVAGTHGKTTTTSILAFLLEAAGRDPGFLVGGVPENFGVSARLGTGDEFVVEADEYDTAFFDKRSKFVHYAPSVAILNNLEYDHADIFPDLAAIQRQFHHLVRIVPGNGRLIVNGEDAALRDVLAMGCWTAVERFAIDADAEWQARLLHADGSDANVYPPMSTQLEQLGISLSQGYRADAIAADTDVVVVGNALSRGNAAVEHVLDAALPYTSGAQWLHDNVLPGRRVLAVAGTHGKTTTTSILAFLLEAAGRDPGFLIGGVPENFGVSARLGTGDEFVVEADEYDTAFFDKRSKFVHYRPSIAILNNLEYDHADIFPDVEA
ncbi:MAG: UDP-N-acetylmuramate:L-alanyl-gamma-D-glutamyl-meso-diaminopimelate ligase, partial [Arenimonas sp.]